jgi:predicted acylesterase/phospholipase RssA
MEMGALLPGRKGVRLIGEEGAAHGPKEASPPASASPRALADWRRGLRAASQRLNLALQGGGADIAFTWGVLDALFEDPHVVFECLSGSSAGAMNAVVPADG